MLRGNTGLCPDAKVKKGTNMFKVNLMSDIRHPPSPPPPPPPTPKAQPHGESQEVKSCGSIAAAKYYEYVQQSFDCQFCSTVHNSYLEESPPPKGALKQGTPLCRRLRKACAVSLASEAGSILQNDPLPGSSWERGTLTKYRFSDKL